MTGNESISSLLTPAISAQQGIGQPNDPFLSYLQGQQGYAASTDQLYQNNLKSIEQQASNFAWGNLSSSQILAQINANGGLNSTDPNTQVMIQNYNTALGNESNTFQSYLNQENSTQQNYLNAINSFQAGITNQQQRAIRCDGDDGSLDDGGVAVEFAGDFDFLFLSFYKAKDS